MLVLYDSRCPFCARCREWLEAREQEVPLRFACCRSPEVRARYGRIEALGRELVVVDGAGNYWAGPAAFVVCFWALSSFRWIALVAAWPFVYPIAQALFAMVTANRGVLGSFVGAPCAGEQCALPPAHSPYR